MSLSFPKSLFFKFYLFIFRERGRKEEKHQCERETLIGCLSHTPKMGSWPTTPGMCPDQELNQQPFSLWHDAQPTEPHQSGQEFIF